MPSSKSNPKLKPKSPTTEWSFAAIGTSWWIGIYETITAAELEITKALIARRIEIFDQTYSRFRNDSLVSQIARQAGQFSLPSDSAQLFVLYRQLYETSGGLVTPLIGKTLSDAGYDAHYSLRPRNIQRPPAWDDVMDYRDNVLATRRPVLLDIGAAGKGYLVDLVAGILTKQGINRFCIDAGGDILCRGLNESLSIGLENPENFSQVIGVAQLQDGALCASAGNRRAWGKFHHIINPRTLNSPRHIAAVWVTADNTALADGLATTLFFVPPAVLQQTFTFQYIIMEADMTIQHSPDFHTELFTRETTHVR